MTRRPFNLASRPFRNETLPALLLAVGFVLLVAGTVAQVLAVRRLLPAHTSARHQEVDQLEARLQRLEARAVELRREVPAETLEEWLFVKDMVDRRAFSWTRLLRDLEESLPPGVRVASLAPDVDGARLELRLDAQVRGSEDGLELVRRLEERPEFEHVDPLSTSELAEGGRMLRLRMDYAPRPAPDEAEPAAAAEPAPRKAKTRRSEARAAEVQP